MNQQITWITRIRKLVQLESSERPKVSLTVKLDQEDAELWFRKGVVHRHRGESAEAERCWRWILSLTRPDEFCSVDQGIYGHLPRRNLAERGDHAEAERLWQAVLAECPLHPSIERSRPTSRLR
jgi:hypothetical protein